MLPTPQQTDYSESAHLSKDPQMSVPTTDTPQLLAENPRPTVVPPQDDIASEIINVPNSLTLLRIFLVPFLVVVLLTKFYGREWVGLTIFLIAAVTDFFDGWIARRSNKITRLGALLDPIADKLLMSAAFISLVELGLAPAWMIVIIIGREFAVSGLRSIAAQQGVTIAASPLGKSKTISQVIAIALLILGDQLGRFIMLSKLSLWAVMLFALVSGVDYFLKFSRAVLRPGK
jgi:CDP-diacylglycerol--glycerol-3-phosphate 3-phosphatidyltransferase